VARGDTHLADSVGLIEKTDEVLGLLREHGQMTVAQVAEGIGEPRPSVHRLMAALEDLELIDPGTQPGTYLLGLRLFSLSKIVEAQLPAIPAARAAMETLLKATGETVYLFIRREYEALCVALLEGSGVQSMAVDKGGSLPLHLGAGPRVLLAHADENFAEDYLRTRALQRRTGNSNSSARSIRRQLGEIRNRGYAISDEDLIEGIAAVGAPLRSESGEVVAALSISGARASILEPSAERTIQLVCDAAATVSIPAA
jgi:DNA-binding IclR family transcriptional regulator